jgi:Arc/MetJ family transcription regulator
VLVHIDIDDELMAEAMRISGMKTEKLTVEAALIELIRRYKLREVGALRGTVEWEGDLDQIRQGE